MVCAYIGLGSNLEQPQDQVRRAILELGQIPQTRVVNHSRWYRSKAVGPGDQPDYINGVAQLETGLDAHKLLDHLQAIEQAHQRIRIEHWGPRTLDLDLLLYGDDTISSERLTVPHAHMTERNFVLFPLAELAQNLTLPSGESLGSLLSLSNKDGLETLAD